MSNLSNLAADFEKKSKLQAHDTEKGLKIEFERHETFIEQALRSSEQKIKDDIRVQNQRMSALVLKSWLWIVLSVVLILVACSSVIWWQGMIITQNQIEISNQQLALKELEAKGGKIHLTRCGERICIVSAEDNGNWTRKRDNRPLFIPEGY